MSRALLRRKRKKDIQTPLVLARIQLIIRFVVWHWHARNFIRILFKSVEICFDEFDELKRLVYPTRYHSVAFLYCMSEFYHHWALRDAIISHIFFFCSGRFEFFDCSTIFNVFTISVWENITRIHVSYIISY